MAPAALTSSVTLSGALPQVEQGETTQDIAGAPGVPGSSAPFSSPHVSERTKTNVALEKSFREQCPRNSSLDIYQLA